MNIRIWKKRDTQKFATRLRRSGYDVTRTNTGYVCFEYGPDGKTVVVFTALEGRSNYIVRLNPDYITQET